MKVIYKKLLMEQINKAIVEAKKENREIDKVVLTPEEFDRLRAELTYHGSFVLPRRLVNTSEGCFFNSVRVEVEESEEDF